MDLRTLSPSAFGSESVSVLIAKIRDCSQSVFEPACLIAQRRAQRMLSLFAFVDDDA